MRYFKYEIYLNLITGDIGTSRNVKSSKVSAKNDPNCFYIATLHSWNSIKATYDDNKITWIIKGRQIQERKIKLNFEQVILRTAHSDLHNEQTKINYS